MSEPTYKIAQRLHERRAAKGMETYGRHLDANSKGCMLVHALEEAADQVNYLLAEIQRRADAIRKLIAMVDDMEAQGYWPMMHRANAVIDLLGGRAALSQYDEFLGTVAENATVDPRAMVAEGIAELRASLSPDPRDEALRVAAGKIHHWHDWGDNNEGMVVSSAAVRELWGALAAIRGAR